MSKNVLPHRYTHICETERFLIISFEKCCSIVILGQIPIVLY